MILAKLFAGLAPQILNLLTPEIKELLEGAIKDLYQRALATPNPFDDFGVRLLAGVLGVDLDEDEFHHPGGN